MSAKPDLQRLVRFGWQTLAIGMLTCALAELCVRSIRYFAPAALPSMAFYDQSYNRYRGRPGAPIYGFPLNSKGFKDVEFATDTLPGVRRVVAIGDSFAFGAVPYPHNYLTLVEDHLNAQGLRTEILNMGIPGLAPQDYLALLVHEGFALRPDLVLLSFFVGNDFDETMRLRTRLYEASNLLALARFVIGTGLRLDERAYDTETEYDDLAPYFRESTYLAVQKQRSWIFRKPASHPKALTDAVDYLVQIRDLCARDDIALLVLVIPDEMQVDPAVQKQVLQALRLAPQDLDFLQPNRFLADAFRRHGIDSIDLLDAFVTRGQEIRLYKPLDTHWNLEGNALAASVLAGPLASHLSGRVSR